MRVGKVLFTCILWERKCAFGAAPREKSNLRYSPLLSVFFHTRAAAKGANDPGRWAREQYLHRKLVGSHSQSVGVPQSGEYRRHISQERLILQHFFRHLQDVETF